MKLEYIKRGAATRLILIFGGWSTDARFYSDCCLEGWDTAVVSDYRDMTPPKIPTHYSTVYLFAYSLGVWAASSVCPNATVKVAVFGTPIPSSDLYGIPETVFRATAENLDERNLAKFHLRMAGDKTSCELLSLRLPANPDIDALKDELISISNSKISSHLNDYQWHRAYIADADRIFPAKNQLRYWKSRNATEIVTLNSSHAADMASIIRQCISEPQYVGKGFANASESYRSHAIVQSEVCGRIGEMLLEHFNEKDNKIGSLLEIGAGMGLLTDVWSKLINPESATYVDLYATEPFGNADRETIIVADAEDWIEHSDETFDVILSASAIQWFANPINFIAELKKHLNPGGIAIISTFCKGNFHELAPHRPSPIIYRDADEYEAIEHADVEKWQRTLEFDSPRDMLIHLKRTGVQPSGAPNRLQKRETLKLSSLPNKLTYAPLILKIKKT